MWVLENIYRQRRHVQSSRCNPSRWNWKKAETLTGKGRQSYSVQADKDTRFSFLAQGSHRESVRPSLAEIFPGSDLWVGFSALRMIPVDLGNLSGSEHDNPCFVRLSRVDCVLGFPGTGLSLLSWSSFLRVCDVLKRCASDPWPHCKWCKVCSPCQETLGHVSRCSWEILIVTRCWLCCWSQVKSWQHGTLEKTRIVFRLVESVRNSSC